MLRIAWHTERSGWDGVWLPDHFMSADGDISLPVLESWASLVGLAAVVPRVRLGTPVHLPAPDGARQHHGGGRLRERMTSRIWHRCRVAGKRACGLRNRAVGSWAATESLRGSVVEGSVEQLRDTLGRYAAAGVDE